MDTIQQQLKTVADNKVTITKLTSANREIYKDVIIRVYEEINTLKTEDKIYAKASKKTLAKLLKTRYDSKDGVINTVLNTIILGLKIDNTISIGAINKTVTYLNKGLLTKSKINKLDKTELLKELKKITKSLMVAKYSK